MGENSHPPRGTPDGPGFETILDLGFYLGGPKCARGRKNGKRLWIVFRILGLKSFGKMGLWKSGVLDTRTLNRAFKELPSFYLPLPVTPSS